MHAPTHVPIPLSPGGLGLRSQNPRKEWPQNIGQCWRFQKKRATCSGSGSRLRSPHPPPHIQRPGGRADDLVKDFLSAVSRPWLFLGPKAPPSLRVGGVRPANFFCSPCNPPRPPPRPPPHDFTRVRCKGFDLISAGALLVAGGYTPPLYIR